jgi:hypothetical protein
MYWFWCLSCGLSLLYNLPFYNLPTFFFFFFFPSFLPTSERGVAAVWKDLRAWLCALLALGLHFILLMVEVLPGKKNTHLSIIHAPKVGGKSGR